MLNYSYDGIYGHIIITKWFSASCVLGVVLGWGVGVGGAVLWGVGGGVWGLMFLSQAVAFIFSCFPL